MWGGTFIIVFVSLSLSLSLCVCVCVCVCVFLGKPQKKKVQLCYICVIPPKTHLVVGWGGGSQSTTSPCINILKVHKKGTTWCIHVARWAKMGQNSFKVGAIVQFELPKWSNIIISGKTCC